MTNFKQFFQELTGHAPFPYQEALATNDWPELVDVPTGLGKTAAILAAFLWKRLNGDHDTGRRLVYCLPMRSLVEQTSASAAQMCERAAPFFSKEDEPRAHILMGGEVEDDWEREPLATRILVGTQDMLLSRALNRGYGMSRYKWPVHFGLLSNDCLWALDETQLIGVGIETTAQLVGLREAMGTIGPAKTVWMSATLGRDQLATVDHPEPASGHATCALGSADKDQAAVVERLSARKAFANCPLNLNKANEKHYAEELAAQVLALHEQRKGLTLVVLNRVDRAQAVYTALGKRINSEAHIALVHSRYRPADRKRHEDLLHAAGNRIVIATQAIEAGVDVSATTLITELCPWPSMVQRLGRLNRYGEQAQGLAFWVDIELANDKDALALPYGADDLNAARQLAKGLDDAGPSSLAALDYHPPFQVRPVLRRKDLSDFFDTSPDLSGYDIDVSRFIRDGGDTDLQIYFRDWQGKIPPEISPPRRDELCRISRNAACELFSALKKHRAKLGKADRSAESHRWTPWQWNPLRDKFEAATQAFAGQVLMLAPETGVYSAKLGYTGEVGSSEITQVLVGAMPDARESMDADPDSHQAKWIELTLHLGHVESEAIELLEGLLPAEASAPAEEI